MEKKAIIKTEEKKMWVNPHLIVIEKETIEGGANVGNDGGGTSTRS